MKKNRLGQFFTKKDCWMQKQIIDFIGHYNKKNILDPFAGDGCLLNNFKNKNVIGLDIDKALGWKINNSLNNITNIKNCFIVTNPPYLSKTSNKRKNIGHTAFKKSNKNDLYKIALDSILKTNMPGIAIVPESFINSSYSKKHIFSITIIIPNPFKDTETPICVICFDPNQKFKKTWIYKNDSKIGYLDEIKNIADNLIRQNNEIEIKFNDENGKLALIGYDSITGNPIKFVKSKKLNYNRPQKVSSRVVSKIKINKYVSLNLIEKLNNQLNKYRDISNDILLTPFKGNNNKEERRRRLDYRTARKIINSLKL